MYACRFFACFPQGLLPRLALIWRGKKKRGGKIGEWREKKSAPQRTVSLAPRKIAAEAAAGVLWSKSGE